MTQNACVCKGYIDSELITQEETGLFLQIKQFIN